MSFSELLQLSRVHVVTAWQPYHSAITALRKNSR